MGRRSSIPVLHLEKAPGFLLYKTHLRALSVFRRALEAVQLTPLQFGLLAMLHERDGHSHAALAALGEIDPNTMVGLIDRLQAAGLVERARAPRDRRVYLVRLTDAGRTAFENALPCQRAAARTFFGVLSMDEVGQFCRLLNKLLGTAAAAPRPDDAGVHE